MTVVALVEELYAAGVPLYGLTNWSAETFPHVETRYDFLEVLPPHRGVGSDQTIKPEARI